MRLNYLVTNLKLCVRNDVLYTRAIGMGTNSEIIMMNFSEKDTNST